VQMLRHTYPILHFFVQSDWEDYVNTSVDSGAASVQLSVKWHALLKVFEKTALQKTTCSISPRYFMQAVRQASREGAAVTRFADGQQHDVADFMQFCLDQLHASTALRVDMVTEGKPQNREDEMMVQSYEAFRKHFESEYSVVIEMFAGQFYQSVRTCDDDLALPFKSSETYDPFTILQLPIPTSLRRACTLYDCLDHFVSAETIQGWKPTAESPPRLALHGGLPRLPQWHLAPLQRRHRVQPRAGLPAARARRLPADVPKEAALAYLLLVCCERV
jgi:ubiquitin carboxyl-terminal hydrolase 8